MIGRAFDIASRIGLGAVAGAFSVSVSIAEDQGYSSGSVSAAGPSPDTGLPIEGWMFYPSFFAGAVFNDNIYSTSTNRIAGVGLRLRPSLQGTQDNGLHATSVWLTADAQIYPGTGQRYFFYPTPTVYAQPTNITGSAGFNHVWRPTSDLTFQVVGAYTRQNGLFGANYGGAGTAVTPNSYTVSNAQQYSNQFTGTISAQKDFGQWFLRGSSGAQYVSYDSQPSGNFPFGGNRANPSQNGLSYNATVRGGYWLTPLLYSFVEPGAVVNRYAHSASDSNGYRVVGGLGTSMISLFKGEIFGGYNAQFAVNSRHSVSSPTFGANLFYYPTPYLTLSTTISQSIGFGAPAAFSGVAIGPGPSSRTWQAVVQATYSLSQYWSASARAGYGETRWANDFGLNGPGFGGQWWNGGAHSVNANWTAGAHLDYNFWRNTTVTLDYQFTRAVGYGGANWSGWPFINPWAPTGYARNLISAGVTYRY